MWSEGSTLRGDQDDQPGGEHGEQEGGSLPSRGGVHPEYPGEGKILILTFLAFFKRN